MCGKKVPEFICDSCNKTYYWPNPLREHYYKERLKVVLYHCTSCNKPFHYSNKLSVHNRFQCPKKDGPEIYEGKMELDKTIEEKFKRREAVEFEEPSAEQSVSQQEMAEQETGDQEIQETDQDVQPPTQELPPVLPQQTAPLGFQVNPTVQVATEVQPCGQSSKDVTEDPGQEQHPPRIQPEFDDAEI